MTNTYQIGQALFERIWKQYLTDDVALKLFDKIVPEEYREEIQQKKRTGEGPSSSNHYFNLWLDEKNITLKPIVDWLENLFERILPTIDCNDGLFYEDDQEVQDIFYNICLKVFAHNEYLKNNKKFSG
jgi:hypothetical protein